MHNGRNKEERGRHGCAWPLQASAMGRRALNRARPDRRKRALETLPSASDGQAVGTTSVRVNNPLRSAGERAVSMLPRTMLGNIIASGALQPLAKSGMP